MHPQYTGAIGMPPRNEHIWVMALDANALLTVPLRLAGEHSPASLPTRRQDRFLLAGHFMLLHLKRHRGRVQLLLLLRHQFPLIPHGHA